MKVKDDEIIIKKREYIDLLMENLKLREQASPFNKYSIDEIREMFGFSKIELEEKEVPEKITAQDLLDLDTGSLLKRIVDNQNQLIDCLKSKGDK